MVQSIQYHKYQTLYHVTEAEAEELAEKYHNNKKEKHNSVKGMKNASKENAGIVASKSQYHVTTSHNSQRKVKRKKAKPIK